MGNKTDIIKAKREFSEVLECEDGGEIKEHIGRKINNDWRENSMTITQPVLLQSLKDKFKLPSANLVVLLPAGLIFQKGSTNELIF